MRILLFGYSLKTQEAINIFGIDNVIGIIDSVAMNVGKTVLMKKVELMTRRTKIPEDAIVISTASDSFESAVVLEKFNVKHYYMFDDIKDFFEKKDINIGSVIESYEKTTEYWKKKATYLKFVELRYKKQLEYLMKQTSAYNLLPSKGYIRRTQQNYLKYAIETFEELYELNIHPFCTFGTLLGAIRHKGFIPWDDDFDMALIRNEYQAVIDYYKSKEKCYIFDGLYPDLYQWVDETIKANKNETILIIYADQIQLTKGTSIIDRVFVDLFPYDFYSEGYTFSEMKEEKNINVKVIKDPNTTFEQRVKYISERREYNKSVGTTCDDSSKVFFGIDSYEMYYKDTYTDFIPKDVIFPLKKMEFEGHMLYAPNKAEEYMKIQYRNFESYPSDIGVSKHDHWYKYRLDHYINVELVVKCPEDVKKLYYLYDNLRKRGINALYYIDEYADEETRNEIEDVEAEFHDDFNAKCDICFIPQDSDTKHLIEYSKIRYYDRSKNDGALIQQLEEVVRLAEKEGKII